MSTVLCVNEQIAGRLEEVAHLLRDQGADPFRVGAYVRAAATVRSMREPKALRRVPADLAELTRRAREQGLRVEFVHRDFDSFIREMDRSSNRLSFAVVIAATVIASAIMVHARVGPTVYGYPALGLLGFVIAGLLGLGLAIGILRSGRL